MIPDPFTDCPFEGPVLAALARASLTGDLFSHAQCCATCREAIAGWSYLNTLAASEADSPLPSPHFIWWKAQLAEQRRAAQRSVTLIQLCHNVALAAAALALSVCLAWILAHRAVSVPPICLLGVIVLIALSLLTAVSFLYSEKHSSRL